jgi:hypothetical protein
MDCYCNNSDITIGFEYLADEINEVYHRLINFSFIMGGVVLITTLTNMTLLCNIKKKLNDINKNLMPPLYKVSS